MARLDTLNRTPFVEQTLKLMRKVICIRYVERKTD